MSFGDTLLKLHAPDETGISLVAGACFASGTLVYTKDGLVPIEDIKIGDRVLAQPEQTGEQAYKRVVSTTKHESKPVYRVSYYSDNDPGKRGVLIVTGNHPFYVAGHVKEDFPKPMWDELHRRIGWRQADKLEYGELLLLANGELVRVGSVNPIWRTRIDGVGWIETRRESETGNQIDLRSGKVQESMKFGSSDFIGEGTFNERYELEETFEEWAYKCDVYDFEVEEFHTYYVGDMGVWVHNTTFGECSPEKLAAPLAKAMLNWSLNSAAPTENAVLRRVWRAGQLQR
jgi:hypothetical protein